MARREKKRKSRTFLKDAIRNTQKEIDILMSRLEKKSSSYSVECRVCCLMNRTLPNLQNSLKSLERKESREFWI